MKPMVFLLLALGLWTCAGCFSATTKHGRKDPPSPAELVAAGAADVVTSPLQATAYVAATPLRARRAKQVDDERELVDRIRRDPELVFRERLIHREDRVGREALSRVLWDPSVAFTEDQLERLYRDLDHRKYWVLRHPACSLAFLGEIERSLGGMPVAERAEHIMHLSQHPRLPLAWLERWAADPLAYGAGAAHARSAIQRRRGG